MKIYRVNIDLLKKEHKQNDVLADAVCGWEKKRGLWYLSQARFAKSIGVKTSAYVKLLNCETSPFDRSGKYKSSAKKIARAVGMRCADLYPSHLYSHLLPPQGRNTLLERLIQETGMTNKAFAESLGVNVSRLSGLITLRISPFGKTGDYLEICRFIASAVGCSVEELFPPELYLVGFLEEVPVHSLDEVDHDIEAPLQLGEEPSRFAIQSEQASVLLQEMDQVLTYRERWVLKLRWGILDGQGYYSYNEISRITRMLPHKVRELECNGIRKLQDSEKLREVLSGGGE